MGRHQTTRQNARQSIRHPTVKQSRKVTSTPARATRRPITPAFLIRLLVRYPIVLLLGAWALSALAATVAVRDMLSVGSVRPADAVFSVILPEAEQPSPVSPQTTPVPQTPAVSPVEEPSPAAELESPSPTASPIPALPAPASFRQELPRLETRTSRFLPWVALALSCAVGCILITKSLKPRPPVRKMRAMKPRLEAKPVPTALPLLPAAPVPPSPVAQFTPQFPDPIDAPPVTITVVSADQIHPLDWDEPSLADSLDLRQRQPLSYWLVKDWKDA